MISRRAMLRRMAAAALVSPWLSGCRIDYVNPCPTAPLPDELARHPLVKAAWEGIDPHQCWDVHAHLTGSGDDPTSGIRINPRYTSSLHPLDQLARQGLLSAACVDEKEVDRSYLRRLLHLLEAFPEGYKVMLLAFDGCYGEDGQLKPELSPFVVPDAYAARMAGQHPERLQWIASVHPYRSDAIPALEEAAAQGAMAVKWLPQAMAMDPASSRCDAFYEALTRLRLPLLCHTGVEHAVHGGGAQELGNPLRLRRPLEAGVMVIAAHCASLGSMKDTDQGPDGPSTPAYKLLFRLMDDPRYHHLLWADLSAILLVNRSLEFHQELLQHTERHPRLLHGSDYPLPGANPLISPSKLADRGLLAPEAAPVIDALRIHNPLLGEFVLKRSLRFNGQGLSPEAFLTRRAFSRAG